MKASHNHVAVFLAALFTGVLLYGAGTPVSAQQPSKKTDASSSILPAEHAARMVGSYGAFISLAVVKEQGAETLIYRSVEAVSEPKTVLMDIEMPRETFCALLSRNLSAY